VMQCGQSCLQFDAHCLWFYAVDATNSRESIGPHFSGFLFLQSYVSKILIVPAVAS
jgi:hypothetical protein